MKHAFSFPVIVGVLLFVLVPRLCAEDAPALPQINEFQQKALECLKDKRPGLKPESLVFSSIEYSYQPQPTTRKVFDAQGNEHWITDTAFTQSLRVTFVDRSTRAEQVVAGERVAISQLFSVQFNQALTACVYVSDGTSTEHLH